MCLCATKLKPGSSSSSSSSSSRSSIGNGIGRRDVETAE